MMISAPARRIDVSVSIIARGSSIQPFRAAAFSIAYSPLTWYAAVGIAELRLHPRDDVEIGERRLDHDDVGPFLDIERDLAQRLLDVGRIHLVRSAIAEGRRRIGRLAERAVERRTVLRRVRHDRRLREPRLVERRADAADAAVHHVGRRDDVGAGRGVRQRGARQLLDGHVVGNLVVDEDAAVPVRRVFAEADIGDDEQPRHFLLDRADGGLHRRLPDRRPPIRRCLSRRAGRRAARRARRPLSPRPPRCTASSTDNWNTPGIEPTSRRCPSPGQTKSG